MSKMLTKRELKILEEFAKGYSLREITQRTNYAYSTITTTLYDIRLKLFGERNKRSADNTFLIMWYLDQKGALSEKWNYKNKGKFSL